MFSTLSVLERRPIARTCAPLIELPLLVFGSCRRIEFEQEMELQSWIPYYDKLTILIKYLNTLYFQIIFTNLF